MDDSSQSNPDRRIKLYLFWEWEYRRRSAEYNDDYYFCYPTSSKDFEEYLEAHNKVNIGKILYEEDDIDEKYDPTEIFELEKEWERIKDEYLEQLKKKDPRFTEEFLSLKTMDIEFKYYDEMEAPHEGISSDDLLKKVLKEGDDFQPPEEESYYRNNTRHCFSIMDEGVTHVKDYGIEENVYDDIGLRMDRCYDKNSLKMLLIVDLGKDIKQLLAEFKFLYFNRIYSIKIQYLRRLEEWIRRMFMNGAFRSEGTINKKRKFCDRKEMVRERMRKCREMLDDITNEYRKNYWDYRMRDLTMRKKGDLFKNKRRAFGLWLWDQYQEQLKRDGNDNKMDVIRKLAEKYPQTKIEKGTTASTEKKPKRYRRYLDRTDDCIKAGKVLPMS